MKRDNVTGSKQLFQAVDLLRSDRKPSLASLLPFDILRITTESANSVVSMSSEGGREG